MSTPIAPLNTILKTDTVQPEQMGAALPTQLLPSPKNYADNQQVIDRVRREILPLIQSVRLDRQIREQEWLEVLRMHRMEHDANQRYKGRSNAYLPIWAQIEKTQTASLSRGLFPSDEYLNVLDAESENPQAAQPTQKYLKWEFEQRGKLRRNIKPALRQKFRFGTSPMKIFYNKLPQGQKKTRGTIAKLGDVMAGKFVEDTSHEGMRISTRSVLSWYCYPTTAQSLDECTLVFEDIDVTRGQVEELIRKGYWASLDINDVMDGYRNSQAAFSKRWDLDNAGTLQGQGHQSPQGQQGVITEGYAMMQLPSDAYVMGEDPKDLLPVRLTLAGEQILEVRRNPHFHQRAPYVVGRMDNDSTSFYGEGLGRRVAALQYLCNDFANQTADVGQYVLNPVWKAVRGLMGGPMKPIAPGRVYNVNDPDALTPMQMDTTLIGAGQAMLNLWLQMAQDWSGTPAIQMGIGGARSGKTATQSQILQNNQGTANQDVVEDYEQDVLIPMMYMTWVNGMQFLPDSVMMQVSQQMQRLSKEQLAINPVFIWLASSQAMNRAQRVQQALSLLQVTAPMIPLINQTGYAVDVVKLIERVWTDGLGMRGFQDFIRPLSQEEKTLIAQAQMGGAGAAGGPPQIPGQEGDRIRSAVEQAVGGSGEMAPGEGEDFMQVRNEADQMAALMGGGGF